MPGCLLFTLVFSTPAWGVIPGLAPGAAALLPQLILFLLAVLALLFSPRTWWSLARAAARRPGRAAALCLGLALAVLGIAQLPRLFPAPRPGTEISDELNGFLAGDAGAHRGLQGGTGPLAAPLSACIRWPDSGEADWASAELFPFGDEALALSGDRRWVACLDVPRGAFRWTARQDESVSAGPLGYQQRLEDGGRRRGVVLATVSGRVILLNAVDGSPAASAALGPARAMAIADGLLLIALEREIAAVRLDRGQPLGEAWRAARPPREALGLAGDSEGRYFVLDREALLAGDLAGGPLRELRRFPAGPPLRLAVHAGRAYVLLGAAADPARARVACLDPALGAGAPVWERDVARPLQDEISVSGAGVALTFARAMEILDPARGAPQRRLDLPEPASCAAAAGKLSAFLALEGGEVLRYSPLLDRVVWRAAPPADAAGAGAPRSIVAAGERLAMAAKAGVVVLSAPPAGDDPWGQWRGGPSRAGTGDGEHVPLAAAVLWKKEGRGPDPLPLPAGWLRVLAAGRDSALQWLSDDGEVLLQVPLPGAALGVARLGERVFLAQKRAGGDEVVGLLADRSGSGTPELKVLFSASLGLLGPLGSREPLAAGRDCLVVAAGSGLVGLSAGDGSKRWQSPTLAEVPLTEIEAPLVTAGSAYAAGRRPGAAGTAIRAIDIDTGKTRWEVEVDSSKPPALTAAGESVLAAAAGTEGGRLLCLSAAGGSVSWEKRTARPPAGPAAVSGERVFLQDADGGLAVFSLAGMELASGLPGAGLERLEPGRPPPPPVAAFSVLILGRGRSVRCLDSATLEPVWDLELPGSAESLVLARGRIVVQAGGESLCLGAP